MTRQSRLRIGELARRTGVSIKALRLYDERGLLLVAGRSPSNYRVFTPETLDCVQRIRALQAAGVTLREMEELVAAHRNGENFDELLTQTLARTLRRLDEEAGQLEAKRTRLRQLQANIDALSCRYTA